MPEVAPQPQRSSFCSADGCEAPGMGSCSGSPTEVAATAAAGLDAKSRAATCFARSSILQLQRQYPAAFAAIASAAASPGQLQLLQDPLWLTAMGAVHAWEHNTNIESRCNREAEKLSAAAEEGSTIAAAIRDAAKRVGEEDPLVRLHAAALLGEAAALLQSLGEGIAASSLHSSAAGQTSTSSASENNQCLAAAAERAANALELWHLRLMALPVSVSLVSLGSRGATPWKPRPCSALSGVAAAPLLQLPTATDELLLLHQQVRMVLTFLASIDAGALEKAQPLHLRCMHALQQAEQLLLQLTLPAMTAKAGAGGAPEAAAETTTEPAATAAAAADTAAAVPAPQTCNAAALPPPISSSPRPHDGDMNWQLSLRTHEALAAASEQKTSQTASAYTAEQGSGYAMGRERVRCIAWTPLL
ncbi:uncharacterized protein EMH_0093790 [Eimeria mitis]|uniref:Uncharacterized protein n=1 Tax=Eimeria mitis TaxID=44415 RepID=U6JW90_9EIME|nr:uncharacterized protein EMH_0093790 [Eimeria mitis]CDJ27783.1 hypothetical protein, conserved [Eimeria mitis]